jgi:hemerythrin-like domain-containing protein
MSVQSPEPAPTKVLRQEHQVILRVLKILDHLLVRNDQGQGFETASFERCVEFFRLFADACHHAKEENLLFPLLESRGIPREGGPIGVMLQEHTVARELTRRMGEALDALAEGDQGAVTPFIATAREYIQLLTQHIFKEDNVLFAMGDQVMSSEDQSSLCARFGEVGCQAFGGKTREQLAEIATDLEQLWPQNPEPRTHLPSSPDRFSPGPERPR